MNLFSNRVTDIDRMDDDKRFNSSLYSDRHCTVNVGRFYIITLHVAMLC